MIRSHHSWQQIHDHLQLPPFKSIEHALVIDIVDAKRYDVGSSAY